MNFAENQFQLKEMEAKLKELNMKMNPVQENIEMQTRFNNWLVKGGSKAERRCFWLRIDELYDEHTVYT